VPVQFEVLFCKHFNCLFGLRVFGQGVQSSKRQRGALLTRKVRSTDHPNTVSRVFC
jgi:hypothetical protein